jgi:hypothetical protein
MAFSQNKVGNVNVYPCLVRRGLDGDIIGCNRSSFDRARGKYLSMFEVQNGPFPHQANLLRCGMLG